MEQTIICIMLVIVVAVAIVLAIRVQVLRKKIKETEQEIEHQRYFAKVATIANDHVGVQQLEQITMQAEQAMRKYQHMEGFGEYVRPVLHYIIDNTKKLAKGNLPEEERQKISKEVQAYSAKLTNLIENVLLMARIDSDNVTYDMKVHSVEDVVAPVFEQFMNADSEALRIVERKGDVHLSIGKGIPMKIACDNVHLTKALNEVMKNAFQFIEEGNIQVGWFFKMMSNEVEIFVEDNGIGIKDEYQEKIFEPFFKADPSYPGMGIGLTLAKSLVEKMEGKICITSRGDFGTRISILFRAEPHQTSQ